MAELFEEKKQRTRWAKRRQRILQAVGVIAHPEVLVQLRKQKLRMPRVLTHAEGNTEAFVRGENVEVRRSHQAVVCKKRYAVELGKPQMVPGNNSKMERENERQ